MVRMLLLLLSASALVAQTVYQKPPQAVLDVLNAKPTPLVQLSPSKKEIVLLDTVRYPSIKDISKPMLRIAGLRIDPASNGPHLTNYLTGVTIKSLAGGAEKKVATPAGAHLHGLSFSPDGAHFAIANSTDNGVELWVVSMATGAARKIAGVTLNAATGDPIDWMPDSKTLLVLTIPTGRGKAPAAPLVPPGPKIQESDGKAGPTRTYQDMLSSPYDEQLFDYYATSQMALVDLASGKMTPVGAPAIQFGISVATGGNFILATRVHRPYSYLLPFQLFARDIEVIDKKGQNVYTVARLPVAKIPIDGVPVGPRGASWRSTDPQTLVWVEALDGGNPKETVPHRDKMMMFQVPTRMAPVEIARTEQRMGGGFGGGAQWLADGKLILTDYDSKKRIARQFLVDPANPESKRQLTSRNVQDRYRDPGQFVTKALPNGARVLAQSGDAMFLRGSGASPQGDRPFFDKATLGTPKPQRLFHSDPEKYEEVVGMLDDEGSRLLIRSESATTAANYFIRDAAGKMTAVTNFTDPAPQLRGITKELVKYTRPDGVALSFTLYLPAGYKKGTALPTVVWAYPLEYNDADTAGQISGSTKRFNTLAGPTHLFFLTQGYAVLDGASMPVVGSDPETVNNTYLDQVVASAKAAIDKAVEMGVTDRSRVGVGGHSYGAFMTANLLAHSDLFRAGIARSGAYNRTLTPFGFQSERRTLWEAADVYLTMSPFMKANKIKEPILLIHGEADNNQGTFPIQSDRMYQALRGNGATVRYVVLPFESHGYSARESIEHCLAEMLGWFDKHVKNAPQLTSLR